MALSIRMFAVPLVFLSACGQPESDSLSSDPNGNSTGIPSRPDSHTQNENQSDGGQNNSDSSCAPQSCNELRFECGVHDDSCGTTIDCGDCGEGRCIKGQCVRESSTHFTQQAQEWRVPNNGGQGYAGFDALAGSPQELGDHNWTTVDLNGDRLPDLVVTAEAKRREGYNYWSEVFGYGSESHYWYVFYNEGDGFTQQAQEWRVPNNGGQGYAGFDALAGSPQELGDHNWTTVDLNGDRLPDLVVTAEAKRREGYNYWSEVFGYGSDSHYWYVFYNEGDGFAQQAQEWRVPNNGGQGYAGFDALAGSPQELGDHNWTTVDLNGDRLPDLVVTAEAKRREGYNYWSEVFGYGSDSHYWYVFYNEGDGFAQQAQEWRVPNNGGQGYAGFDALAGSPQELGDHNWTTVDLNGDRLPDLVVTAEAKRREGYNYWSEVFGYGSDSHYWYVFYNEGDGFAQQAQEWRVPNNGGQGYAGFDALAGSPQELGDHNWTTVDVNGDGLVELVVTAEAKRREGYNHWSEVFGYGGTPHYWYVFANGGDAFSGQASEWQVPNNGGEGFAGFDALAGSPNELGDHSWTTVDLNGDKKLDLVVTAEAKRREGYNYWSEVFGYGSDSHYWYVFFGSP